ncbi:regulator of cell morphogenesis and NO signaling [Mucilaginibacter oryzae]|uniref:Regulator of cell morphogenesis and NO signaling n=1 Tax=Mucilaginibacter oryzae TaxID=468058 RepID=A0A316HJC1_9SPHI|nr:DUF542 domain-containing protein [Mucilaginibacter oryzae]PWK80140.1 regulator of cell morphogenesis and NO signaling [Mucilaginibacter oryzae]
MDGPEILDITAIEESLAGDLLLEKFSCLPVGGRLVLNLDRDPRSLYFRLIEHTGRNFSWKNLESGPEVWQVKLVKRADLNGEDSIGRIVINDPRKAAVFKEFGIDFSCGGSRTLTEVCEEMQLDVDKVMLKLQGELPDIAYPAMDFPHWDTGFFCKYLVDLHHGYVRANLPFLLETSDKITRSYGAKYTELYELRKLVIKMAERLTADMEQEEEVLFPYFTDVAYALKSGKPLTAPERGPLKQLVYAMDAAHERMFDAFSQIRQLTRGYQPPDYVTHGFRILYKILQEFEDDLQMHLHLENNILFPAAIRNDHELRLRQAQV